MKLQPEDAEHSGITQGQSSGNFGACYSDAALSHEPGTVSGAWLSPQSSQRWHSGTKAQVQGSGASTQGLHLTRNLLTG